MMNTVIAVYYSPSFSRSSGLPDIYRHLKASPVARVQVSPCWQRQFSGRPGCKIRVYHNNLFTHHTSAIPLVKKMHWNFVYCYLPLGKLQGGKKYLSMILSWSSLRVLISSHLRRWFLFWMTNRSLEKNGCRPISGKLLQRRLINFMSAGELGNKEKIHHFLNERFQTNMKLYKVRICGTAPMNDLKGDFR